jgi:hypothetical protein
MGLSGTKRRAAQTKCGCDQHNRVQALECKRAYRMMSRLPSSDPSHTTGMNSIRPEDLEPSFTENLFFKCSLVVSRSVSTQSTNVPRRSPAARPYLCRWVPRVNLLPFRRNSTDKATCSTVARMRDCAKGWRTHPRDDSSGSSPTKPGRTRTQ